MKRRLIGVWFSVALVILVSSLWLGFEVGSAIARYWYGRHWLEDRTLSVFDRARLKSELTELDTAQQLHVVSFVFAQNKPSLRDQYLHNEIKGLLKLKRQSNVPEIGPVIDLELGLAYVNSAITEEQNSDPTLAKTNMQSAQALFESLGWRDYSAETLKVVTKRASNWEIPQTNVDRK